MAGSEGGVEYVCRRGWLIWQLSQVLRIQVQQRLRCLLLLWLRDLGLTRLLSTRELWLIKLIITQQVYPGFPRLRDKEADHVVDLATLPDFQFDVLPQLQGLPLEFLEGVKTLG